MWWFRILTIAVAASLIGACGFRPLYGGGGRSEVAADWFSGPLIVEPASSEIPEGAIPKMQTLLVEAGRIVQD